MQDNQENYFMSLDDELMRILLQDHSKESWRDEYLRWICGFANAQSIVKKERNVN